MSLPLALLFLAAGPPLPAEAVFVNGKVWTGEPAKPEVSAIAVRNGRVALAGTDAEAKALVGPATKVVDLGGKRVIPGVYDSHVHWLGGGLQLSRVELKDADNEGEFAQRLMGFAGGLPRDRWLLGGNWDHDKAFGGKLPTAAMLDKFVKGRPAFLQRYDGHMALVNTAALKLAGITADTPNPPGGVIERLADGKTPSGILKDNAMALVEKLIPEPGDDEIAEAVRAAMRAAAEVGVTSVQDMEGSSPVTRRKLLRVLQGLARRGELTCRIDVRWPIAAQKELEDLGIEANFGTDFVRVGGVKGFMDGSLGSSTAKMSEPYVIDPTTSGVWVTEPPAMRKLVSQADAAGLSVAVHAIGDEANARLLDVFAQAIEANGPRDRRFRIEHAQHLHPDDFQRFRKLGVVASMQPYHAIDDARWAVGRIGAKRCASSYAFRSLLDNSATLAFGSDWPVAPLDPFGGLDAAVNRRGLDGKTPNGWYPEQRLTVTEAVSAYTTGSAYAAFQDKERGTLTTGKFADLVALTQDVFDPEVRDRLGKTQAAVTVFGGKVVFERK
jgi:predicted amidohydrolase YtcJ